MENASHMTLSVESEDWLREFSGQRWISFLFSDESVDGGSSFRSFKYASHWEKCVNLHLVFSVKMKRKLAVSSNFQRKNYMETIDFRISFHTLKLRVNLRCSLHTCLRFEIGSFQERKLRNMTNLHLDYQL